MKNKKVFSRFFQNRKTSSELSMDNLSKELGEYTDINEDHRKKLVNEVQHMPTLWHMNMRYTAAALYFISHYPGMITEEHFTIHNPIFNTIMNKLEITAETIKRKEQIVMYIDAIKYYINTTNVF